MRVARAPACVYSTSMLHRRNGSCRACRQEGRNACASSPWLPFLETAVPTEPVVPRTLGNAGRKQRSPALNLSRISKGDLGRKIPPGVNRPIVPEHAIIRPHNPSMVPPPEYDNVPTLRQRLVARPESRGGLEVAGVSPTRQRDSPA